MTVDPLPRPSAFALFCWGGAGAANGHRRRWPKRRRCTGCARRRWCWREMLRFIPPHSETAPWRMWWSPYCSPRCAARRAKVDAMEAESVGAA